MPSSRGRPPQEPEEDNNGQDGSGIAQRVAVLEERVGNVSREVTENRRLFAVTMERIDAGLSRVEEKIDQRLLQVKEDTRALQDKLEEVREQALSKPSWLTTLVITSLVGMCAALITWVVQNGR